jgi:hypothetical protein
MGDSFTFSNPPFLAKNPYSGTAAYDGQLQILFHPKLERKSPIHLRNRKRSQQQELISILMPNST